MKKKIKTRLLALLSMLLTASSCLSPVEATASVTTTAGNRVSSVSAPELNSVTPGVVTGTYYTVTFDANGSYFKYHEPDFKIASGTTTTYTASSTEKDASGNVTSVTYKIPASEILYGYMSYPENITGKHCIGWNTTPDATAAAANITDAGDTTMLYAVWEDDSSTYTMNYNVNLGQWSGYLKADRNNRRTEVDVNLELQKPTREGYSFLGWYYDPQNATEANRWQESYGLTKYDQVFAVWEATGEPYVVTFDANGGSIDGAAVVTVNVPRNSTGTFTSETPTRTGYTFQGWSTSSTATSGEMSVTVDRSTVTSDVYYFAIWKINSSDPVEPDPDPVIIGDNEPIKTWYIGTNTLTDVKADIYNDGRLIFSGTGMFDTNDAATAWLSSDYRGTIKSVEFQGDLTPTSLAGAFADATSLTTVNLGDMDLDSCTSTKNMFKNCKKLTSFNGSAYTMAKLQDMSGMFDGCKKLSSLSLPYCTSGTLRNMDRAFANCTSLTNLDFSNLDTKYVTSMTELCSGDDSLSSIQVTQSFAVPSSSYVSYDSKGKLFKVTTTEVVPLTVNGQMSSTLNLYATSKFSNDNRTLDYDRDAYMIAVVFDYNYPDGTTYTTKTYCNTGETILTPEVPKATGYDFICWAYNGTAFDFSTPIKEAITLTASWKETDNVTGKTFTITFKYNGNTFATQSVEGYGTVKEVAGPADTSTMTFKHWSTTENGDPFNYTTKVTSDMTLYAVMKRRSDVHLVTFNYNGGKYKGKTSASVNVTDGKKVKKPTYKPKSTGEYFTGWYEDVEGENKWDFTTKIYEDTVIYAGWSDDKDDAEDDDDDSNESDAAPTESGEQGEASANIFDQLLTSLFGQGANDAETSEISSVSVGGIPKTGVPFDARLPLSVLSVLVLLAAYIVYQSKHFRRK